MVGIDPTTATSDFQVILYDGATALETVSFDANAVGKIAAWGWLSVAWSQERSLAKDHDYYVSIKATSTSSGDTVSVGYVDVSAASHLQAHPGGTDFVTASRAGGAWTAITTRRPMIGVLISSVLNGSGTGSGGGSYTWVK